MLNSHRHQNENLQKRHLTANKVAATTTTTSVRSARMVLSERTLRCWNSKTDYNFAGIRRLPTDMYQIAIFLLRFLRRQIHFKEVATFERIFRVVDAAMFLPIMLHRAMKCSGMPPNRPPETAKHRSVITKSRSCLFRMHPRFADRVLERALRPGARLNPNQWSYCKKLARGSQMIAASLSLISLYHRPLLPRLSAASLD